MCLTVESQKVQGCMNFLMILTLICFSLAVLMAYLANQASNQTWLSVSKYNMTEGFFFFFVSIYCLCYLLLICNSIAQYENRPKLWSCWNFKMIIMSFLMTYPSCWSVQYMQDLIDSKEQYLEPDKATLSMNNKNSPMFILVDVVKNSERLVCSS